MNTLIQAHTATHKIITPICTLKSLILAILITIDTTNIIILEIPFSNDSGNCFHTTLKLVVVLAVVVLVVTVAIVVVVV